MSITDDIRSRVAALEGKRLFHLPTLLPGDRPKREVIVSSEVHDIATMPWPENYEGLRQSSFRAVLDDFTVGEEFSVAEKPFDKPGHSMLARVHPVSDELWDIRSTDPRPGIRALGAFGGKNFLIVLSWDYRENFENSEDWAREVRYCKKQWNDLFDGIPRFKGRTLVVKTKRKSPSGNQEIWAKQAF